MRARPSRTSRPNLSGEQLVQEYLTRVAAAARHLPKGARMAFVGRTKAQIERQCGGAGLTDPGQVLEALASLGEPEELVRQERMRIDSKWLSKRAKDDTAPGAAAPPTSRTPRVYRPLNSRWRPAAPHFRQPTRRPGRSVPPEGTTAGEIVAGPVGDTGQGGVPGTVGIPGAVADPGIIAGPSPVADPADAEAADLVRPVATPEPPAPVPPAPWPGELDAMMPPGEDTGEDGAVPGGPQTPLDGIWQLARGNLREAVAVVMIGLGGAILPFPFWIAGAVVALFSRLWDGKDKTAAWGGPVLIVLIGSVVSALFVNGHHQNVILTYTDAIGSAAGLWVRLGCVLTALYLSWRVSQGPRVKVPPWRR